MGAMLDSEYKYRHRRVLAAELRGVPNPTERESGPFAFLIHLDSSAHCVNPVDIHPVPSRDF